MIEASAPVRICDTGGWTDTWFGGPGRVVNIAVAPGVAVTVTQVGGPHPVTLAVEPAGDRYALHPGSGRPGRHPLLEAAIALHPPPADAAVEVRVRAWVPPGSGAGTSAAAAVALLAALGALRGDRPSPLDLAYGAHRVEVDALGAESGIQDQLSAALGGINYLEIDPYPEARVRTLPSWPALDPLLSLVFLGRAHDSSALHRMVIAGVGERRDVLDRLRAAAAAARDAVLARDLGAFARAMVANTEAQEDLHPGLVGAAAHRVMDLAAAHGALGWKVNGAGGDGGSLTLLSPSPAVRAAIHAAVASLGDGVRVVPVRVSPDGVRVTGSL